RKCRKPTKRGSGIKLSHPVEHSSRVGKLPRAIVECALASSHAPEIEPPHGTAKLMEPVIKLIPERVVHCTPILGVGMQDECHRRIGTFLSQVARFDPACRAWK